jgi:hypothetical protein
MEEICSAETSVDFQRTTRRYIPEDGTLPNHRCENLKSYRALLAIYFHVGSLLVLFFDPEDWGDMFRRNVGWLSKDYTAIYPRRCYSS